MHLHSQPMPDDPNLQAVMYGPIVLAGVMDKDTPIAEDVNTGYLPVAHRDPSTWLKPVLGQALTFQTVGTAHPVTFTPLYNIIDQRFGVYWDLVTPNSRRAQSLAAIEKSKQTRNRRVVDQVNVAPGLATGCTTATGRLSAGT